MFCLQPIPADRTTVIRFLTHLSTYCKYTTIINYLSAFNVLHRHFGYELKFQEHFLVILLLCGLRRILDNSREKKLLITPGILQRLHSQIRLLRDTGFWAAMLLGFITFFGKSNLVPKSLSIFDSSRNVSVQDIRIRPWSMVKVVRWSKTIQFRNAVF